MMPYVKAFSERYGAEIILLHVLDPVYVIPETGISPPTLIPIPQWLFDQKAAQLETLAVPDLIGLPVRRLMYEGDPESQIAATAQSERVGLVIMPTHGRGVFRRFLIGSVTAKVLHDVDCPVLTGTHAQERAHPDATNISKIACAIDLGPESEDVLTSAVNLADIFHADLRFVYVVPRWDPKLRAALSSDLSDQVKEIVKAEIVKSRPASVLQDPQVSIEEGEVAEGVCHFAESSSADLVVIGRGSRTGQAERLNTNTYAIIRQSPCPVLSI